MTLGPRPASEPRIRSLQDSDDSDDDPDELELDEDPPEARNPNLAPLPTTNITNYPQENPSYFARKKYVRNDKFSLRRLLDNSVEVPSMKSVYSRESSD